MRLEAYLLTTKRTHQDRGQRSILQIIRAVGLTEDEIIQASFHSKKIGRRIKSDPDTGLASNLLLEYVGVGDAHQTNDGEAA